MWIQLAVLSSIFLGLYDVAKKHALRSNSVIPILFSATMIGSSIFFVLLLLSWFFPQVALQHHILIQKLSLQAHVQIFLKAVLVASSWVCAFFALKHLPISIAAPIRSSAPAWTLIGALLFFGETLSRTQWLGITITFGSYYVLAWLGRKEDIHFTQNRWIALIVLATFLGAASALYDKFLLLRYPPLAMQAWFYVYLVIVIGAIFLWGWYPRRQRYTPFTWRFSIPLIGVFLAAADFIYFHALAEPGAMISIVSVVRRSSVIIAFLLGGHLFNEVRKKQKALALLGILMGVVLIALAKQR